MDRRAFLRRAIIGAGTSSIALSGRALAQSAVPGAGPYGSLDGRQPDEAGLIVPEGFIGRVVATSGELVPGTGHVWHGAPDGGACFGTGDGGWIVVSNSEIGDGQGGVGAIEFDADGSVVAARTILSGTSRNCAGGPTPWGTWLSCEEFDTTDGDGEPAPQPAGMVWETDPTGRREAVALPAMGLFNHEAAAVDPEAGAVYLTEDRSEGLLYRFVPDAYPDLLTGRLEAAVVGPDDAVTWLPVPDPSAASGPVRLQVPEATRFQGGEGIWYHDGVVFFSTKFDGRIHAIHLREQRYELIYDQAAFDSPVLDFVDNVTVDAGSGDVYVAEDGSDPIEIAVITPEREVAAFVRLVGELHEGSEVTGPCFTPDQRRLYFSSQRGGSAGTGMTFEVEGPFRGRDDIAAPLSTPVPSPTLVAPPTAAPADTPATPASPESTPTPSPTAVIAGAADDPQAAGLRDGVAADNDDGSGVGVITVTGVGIGVIAVGGAAALAVRRRNARSQRNHEPTNPERRTGHRS